MFTSLSDVLLAVVRATAALSLSAGFVWGLIRWFKLASPRLQQVVWLLVLLQGTVLLRFPVEIAWDAADVDIAVPSVSTRKPTNASDVNRPEGSVPAAENSGRPARVPIAWQPVVFGIWLLGCGATLAWWTTVYFRVARRDTRSQAPTEDWATEWQRLLDQNGMTAPIHLRVTNETGPVLVWRPGGPEVLVPRTLWERLSSPQRLAILRHELAHFRHGDLWKGALIRLLALPHWFNPLAWWVVKNLDECAEWLCDDEAIGLDRDGATVYAELLLRLGTETRGVGVPATAMRGGRLHGRICRVLTRESKKGSTMRKLLLVTAPLLLLVTQLVRVQLVPAAPPRGADHAAESLPDTTAAELNNSAEPEDRYRLAENEVFKRVGPAYLRRASDADLLTVPQKPDKRDSFRGGGQIYIQEEGQRRLAQSLAAGREGVAVHQLLRFVAGIYPVEMGGEFDLWLQTIHGDFVVRNGAAPEDIVKDTQRILNNELHLSVRLEYRNVERDVYVLRGELKSAPIGPPWRKKPDLATYVIYGKSPPPREFPGVSAVGPFATFLKAVGTRVGRPVITDNIELPKGDLGWAVCLDDADQTNWNTFPQHEARNPADVLKHVSEQIGYTFGNEKRKVRILWLERKK